MGQPTVFPHGVTVYNPEKCWNGYTIVPLINDGVLLFDMNGNEIRRWKCMQCHQNYYLVDMSWD